MAVEDDVKTLRLLIAFVRDVLEWLAEGARPRDHQLRRALLEVWPEVASRLDSAQKQVGEIKAEKDVLWLQLDVVGLTGGTLALKLLVLRRTVAPLLEQPELMETGRPIRRMGVVRRLLRWMNSFLGSLAKALPTVDFVKEYKEMVELTVEHQHSVSPPPRRILDI